MSLQPFHLAIPVNDLAKARSFYSDLLGFEEGRSSDHWVDYNFFGHQLVIHLDPNHKGVMVANAVDGKEVPVPHFGVVLEWDAFDTFADRIRQKGIDFIIEPYLRFEGLAGEQKTLFFKDPSANALEFKSFKHISSLFAT
ncbi:MAG: VOC family protein [Bacteroidetes bacterium]|nr:VOC family protein [Bacteroidota bacterium]MDA0950695.1 VOC family protein [Bacteroidota bacterium]